MPPPTDDLLPQFESIQKMVNVIKQYPITYRNDIALSKIGLDTAWYQIEDKLGLPKELCQQQWRNIKFTYVKLKLLINSGKLKKEIIMSNPEISRFFSGIFDFLDPHLSGIYGSQIPARIHKYVNEMFGLKGVCTRYERISTPVVTHEQVIIALQNKRMEGGDPDSEQVLPDAQNLVKNIIQSKLKEVFSKATSTASVNNSLTPNKELIMRLQRDFIIEEHMDMENPIIINEDFEKTESDDENGEIGSKLTSKEIATEVIDTRNNTLPNDNVNAIIITEENTNVYPQISECSSNTVSGMSDDNMRKIFNELGKEMRIELPKEKQIILKGRINAFLKKYWKNKLF